MAKNSTFRLIMSFVHISFRTMWVRPSLLTPSTKGRWLLTSWGQNWMVLTPTICGIYVGSELATKFLLFDHVRLFLVTFFKIHKANIMYEINEKPVRSTLQWIHGGHLFDIIFLQMDKKVRWYLIIILSFI